VAEAHRPAWQLPLSVVSPVDLGRLIRELNQINESLMQAAIRQPGTPVKLSKTSKLMDEVIELNRLNILLEPDRLRLAKFLALVKQRAPVLHLSFSADPSPLFMQKIMSWLRTEISPAVLVRVGLQPTIGAGCIVRTTNKYFDFSLRSRLTQKKQALAQTLVGLNAKEAEAEA